MAGAWNLPDGNPVDDERVAAGYWKHSALAQDTRPQRLEAETWFWACDAVYEVVRDEPLERALASIFHKIAATRRRPATTPGGRPGRTLGGGYKAQRADRSPLISTSDKSLTGPATADATPPTSTAKVPA